MGSMCLLVSSSTVSDSFSVIPPLIEARKGDVALGPTCISAVIWCCGMEHQIFWNGWRIVRIMVTCLTIEMVLRVLTVLMGTRLGWRMIQQGRSMV
jgi:hypothetical protein